MGRLFDGSAGAGYLPASFCSGLACAAVTWALAACGSGPPPPPVPRVDAERAALGAERRTALQDPVRIIFGWSLSEPDLRTGGRGVVRMEPPYRARLDLFTGNGEGVVRAALVDDELRLPPGMPGDFLPPPALFWAAVGVFRPGAYARLIGGEGKDVESVRLLYRPPGGGELGFVIRERALSEAERLENGHVVERVIVNAGEGPGFPSTSVYRNLAEFRELKFELESIEHVEEFPPDIWLPDR